MTTMKGELDADHKILTLRFEAVDAVRAFVGDTKAQQAFMVEVDAAPKPLETYSVRLEAPGLEFEISARMVQLFPGGGALNAAFQLESWTAEQEKSLEAALSGKGRDETETHGASPVHRIRQMNPNQRAILAAKADRTERRILRRDSTPLVLLSLLSNPRVSSEDVLAVVKSPNVNASLLQRIAEDRRWGSNTEIRTAIARQPKTPPQLAVKLLDKLRTEDLRQMSKTGAVREQVRRAAYRVYQSRQRR